MRTLELLQACAFFICPLQDVCKLGDNDLLAVFKGIIHSFHISHSAPCCV